MKVSATSNTKYLFPALCLVAVVLLILPGSALMTGATKKPIVAAQLSTNPAMVGQWSSTLIPFQTVPLHISLLPNGKLLYWGRDKVTNGSNLEDVSGHSNTYVVDPQYLFNDPLSHTTTFFNTTTNLFCSGHSFLPDGRLLVTGGHEKNSSFPFTEGLGDRSVNIFDYNNTVSPWTRHPTGLSLGRWYPYNVTLANGDVAILGGSYWTNRSTPGAQPISAPNGAPEKYTFAPNGQGAIAVYQQDENPFASIEVYPMAHLIWDGRILISGPNTRLFDPNDANQNGPVGHFVRYPFPFQSNPPGQSKATASSALYNVADGKILVMGGTPGFGGAPIREAVSTDTRISSDWQSAGSMAFKRKFHTATVLPDGKVLVSGGTQCVGANDITCPEFPTPTSGAAVLNPELWSKSSPTVWTTMAASPSAIPRVYHSIALLLPDATVLVGGGGLPGAFGEPGAGPDSESSQFRGYGHKDAEIFSPPYLFDASGQPAVRPIITTVQSNNIGLGHTMQVGFNSTSAITSVVLIRLGSVTHGTNQDQRRIPLSFSASGSNLNVTMPSTGQVCPPGPYMLFILNANGTPSVARIITVSTSKNVAASANNGVAIASSTVNGNFPPSAAINGDRTGATWGTPSGGWNDGSQGAYSYDWVRVDFNGTKTINEIDVYTLRDGFATKTTDPDLTETFNTALNTGSGITSFDVQYLSGSGWITIDCGNAANPCGRVYNNNKVRRQLIFSPVQTSAVRVAVHGAVPFSIPNNYSRLVEIEAYSTGINVAQAVQGSSATASSTFSASYPASAVIDGDRKGRTWGNGGGWNDATEGQFGSDWLQVNFAGTRTINEIDVYTLRDGFASRTDDPTLTEIFNTAPNAGSGITSFNVQYWNGSSWLDVPSGQVGSNNNVWRQFTFSPISTIAIRVVVRDAAVWTSIPNNYSRIVEVEAWDVP